MPTASRKALDLLYDGAAALAALFMLLLLAAVLSSILGREFHFMIPGTDAYAGYFMAASAFLALAHTLRRGEHIRVSLVLSLLPQPWRKRMEIWAGMVSVVLGALLAIFSVRLVMQSLSYNDISTSNDATPLWIPQLSMAIGTVIFFIALLHDLVDAISGKKLASESTAHHE
jgi:TRAP-type C4-dicarboxylate transport system permease small subunit